MHVCLYRPEHTLCHVSMYCICTGIYEHECIINEHVAEQTWQMHTTELWIFLCNTTKWPQWCPIITSHPAILHQQLLLWWTLYNASPCPRQPLSLNLNTWINGQLFWPTRSHFVYQCAVAVNYLVLRVLAVPTGWSCTVYKQLPYEAPRASAVPIAKPSLSDISPHLSSNVTSKINLHWPGLCEWRRQGAAARGRSDGGIHRDGGIRWED